VQQLLIVPTQWTTQTVKQATHNKPLSDIRACLLRCHHACLFGGTYFNGARMIRKPTRGESISITIIGRYRANVPTLTRWNVIWIVWRRQSRVRARCRVCQLCAGQDFPQQSAPSRPFVFKRQGVHVFYKNVTATSKFLAPDRQHQVPYYGPTILQWPLNISAIWRFWHGAWYWYTLLYVKKKKTCNNNVGSICRYRKKFRLQGFVQPCLLYPSSHNFQILTYIFNYVFLVVLLLLRNAYFVSNDGKPRA